MRARSNYIPYDQMRQLWESIPSLHIRKWKDEDIIMMFKIAYWCELRPKEYINLKAEDFDIEHLEVYLGKTKKGKEEYAVIPIPFSTELNNYLIGKKGRLLSDLTYYTVYSWLIKLGKKLDLPALNTSQSITGEKTKGHIFRKSMPKDMIFGLHGRKAPINVISKGLRHKGKNALSSTQEYLKISNEDLKEWWGEESSSINKSEILDYFNDIQRPRFLFNDIISMPDSSGVYFYYDKDDLLLYIGICKNFKARQNGHFSNHEYYLGYLQRMEKSISESKKPEIIYNDLIHTVSMIDKDLNLVKYIEFVEFPVSKIYQIESILIQNYQPGYNKEVRIYNDSVNRNREEKINAIIRDLARLKEREAVQMPGEKQIGSNLF